MCHGSKTRRRRRGTRGSSPARRSAPLLSEMAGRACRPRRPTWTSTSEPNPPAIGADSGCAGARRRGARFRCYRHRATRCAFRQTPATASSCFSQRRRSWRHGRAGSDCRAPQRSRACCGATCASVIMLGRQLRARRQSAGAPGQIATVARFQSMRGATTITTLIKTRL